MSGNTISGVSRQAKYNLRRGALTLSAEMGLRISQPMLVEAALRVASTHESELRAELRLAAKRRDGATSAAASHSELEVKAAADRADRDNRMRLLDDLRGVFKLNERALHTSTILDRLHEFTFWSEDMWPPSGLSAMQLAGMLRPLGVAPIDVRVYDPVSGTSPTRKGYRRDHLAALWEQTEETTG